MASVVIKFDKFLRWQKIQQYMHMIHYKFERRNGRICTASTSAFKICFFINTLYFVFNVYGIVRSIGSDEPSNQNWAVFSIAFYFIIRGLTLYFKYDDIMSLINDLDHIFPQDYAGQQAMDVSSTYEKFMKRYLFMRAYSFVATPMFCCLPVVLYVVTYQGKDSPITVDQQLLAGYLPFGLKQSHKAYPFVWVYDVLGSCGAVAFFLSYDGLFNMLQMQLIMHIDSLARRIRSIDANQSNNNPQFFVELSQLLRHQHHIDELINKFIDIFKLSILLADMVCALSTCFHLYLITETHDAILIAKHSVPTMVLIFFTFEICWRGTQLAEASEKLQEGVYNQNWYMGSIRYRKILLLWLHYTQHPKKLSAYGFVEVNMEHFKDIMQLAYKLFTFLKSH